MKAIKYILAFAALVLLVSCQGKKEIAQSQITADVVEERIEASCTDSDNGAANDISGAVEGILEDGSDFDFEDRCVGNILIEYYCEDNTYNSQNVRCDNKCEDGACK